MRQQNRTAKHPVPELLAPAGGMPQLRAAVNNGADAVYLGGSRFNARAKADNFTMADLRGAIRYTHERNVKIYVTLNTLLKDTELYDALEYADSLRCIGADAVIIQDMGIARLIRKYVPELPMHLSTQGTVYNEWAVDLMKRFGFSRIVPARELTLEELRRFAAVCHGERPAAAGGLSPAETSQQPCEVEVFVHGALCMCYSGQCQLSRMLGSSGGKASARSGNRGLCAQPCRLPYTDDQGRTGFFLSPKDLCLLKDIPALCEAGVDSFKIEGRLKSPEYVAVTTSIYRKYLDQYSRTGEVRVDPQDMEDLRRIYNRGGFTQGYLYGNPGEELLSGSSPRHTGVFAGTVADTVSEASAKDPQTRKAVRGAAKKGAVLADVRPADQKSGARPVLGEGDSVEIRPDPARNAAAGRSGGRITFRKELSGKSGRLIRIGDMKGQIRPGDQVWQVIDTALLESARETFDAEDPAELDRRMRRRIPLKMDFEAGTGRPARLSVTDGAAFAEAVSAEPLEESVNRAPDPERIRSSLLKLGGTPFDARPEDISVSLEGSPHIAAAEINRLRREAVSQLLRIKGGEDRIPMDDAALRRAKEEIESAAAEAPGRLELSEERVPLEEFLEGRKGVPEIFPVSKGRLDQLIESRFDEIAGAAKETGIVIGNAGWILQFLQAGVPVFGGYGLNVFNEQARLAYLEAGIREAEDSLEKHGPSEGRMPLMITEHPLHTKTLTDRMGAVHDTAVTPSGDKTIIY